MPVTPKPTAEMTVTTDRKDTILQGLLTGKPITENHILKQIPFGASILRQWKAQFPIICDISITSSGGVQVADAGCIGIERPFRRHPQPQVAPRF